MRISSGSSSEKTAAFSTLPLSFCLEMSHTKKTKRNKGEEKKNKDNRVNELDENNS